MNFLGFGQSAEIDIVFDAAENRKTAEVKGEDGKMEKMLLYYDGETVSGKVNVTLKKPGGKLEHQGIKIEFIGQIELFYDRGNHHEFKCLAKALARPGDLIQNTSYPFEFPNVEKQFEVYSGSNVRLRYFLRATIVRRISDITREVDIAVHTLCSYPEMNSPIKMEVGIEDCLHIEFEYNKSKYHLKDTIIGKIYFLLVRIKIKHMEIAIIKKEATGTGPNMFTENETIAKYEIMDGAPVKGESIPIRVFLAGYNLTPTMRDINKKFSVKYFLNLVLMDTEDRRYFKQQEITLWRKADIPRYHAQQQHAHHANSPPHLAGVPPNMHTNFASNVQNLEAAHVVTGTGPMSSDGKMGLFTRESPNQDFAQQQDSLPTSPTVTTPTGLTAPPVIASLPPTERGMGDGAASTTNTTSPVTMLSNTPPPLSELSPSPSRQQQHNQGARSEPEELFSEAVATIPPVNLLGGKVAGSAVEVGEGEGEGAATLNVNSSFETDNSNVPPPVDDEDDDEFTNVSKSTQSNAKITTAVNATTTTVGETKSQTSTAVATAVTATPLQAD